MLLCIYVYYVVSTFMKKLLFSAFVIYKILSITQKFGIYTVYGHIMLKTPVLVRSLKLSNIEPC